MESAYSVASFYKPPDNKRAPGSVEQMNRHLESILTPISNESTFSKSRRKYTLTCPKATELISIIRPEFVPQNYRYMFPHRANLEIDFEVESNVRKVWIFIRLIPVKPVPMDQHTSPLMNWFLKSTVHTSTLEEPIKRFFNGRTYQLMLLIAVLPSEIINSFDQMKDIMKRWASIYGVTFQPEHLDNATTRIKDLMIALRDNKEKGYSVIRKFIDSTISNISMHEMNEKIGIIYSTIGVPHYMSNTIRYSMIVLGAQPTKIKQKAFNLIVNGKYRAICPMDFGTFNTNIRTVNMEAMVLAMALLELPPSMPEMSFQKYFMKSIYTKEEQNDGVSTADIARQALCFCSKFVMEIWIMMGWRLDAHIVQKMHRLRDQNWCISPKELVDVVLYTLHD